jgi:hypothetical protein
MERCRVEEPAARLADRPLQVLEIPCRVVVHEVALSAAATFEIRLLVVVTRSPFV